MILKINEELYWFTFAERKVFHRFNKNPAEGRVNYMPVTYVFDPDSYLICESGTDEAATVEAPIVFPSATREEAQKAYIKSLNDKKLDRIFKELNEKEYWDMFWRLFDDGGEKFHAFNMFEERYRLNKIISWCDENNIPYYLDKRDEFIKRILKNNPTNANDNIIE